MDPPSLKDVRNFGSNTNPVSFQSQSNPPTYDDVRKFGSNTNPVSLRSQSNPPTITDVRKVGSNTRPEFFRPSLNHASLEDVNPHLKNSDVVASPVVEKVVDSLFDADKEEIGYKWNYFKENVEKFKKEVKSLKDMKSQVQQQIGIAKDNILSGVEEWLNKAGDEISKAEALLEQEANAKKRCFEEFDHYGKMATKMIPSLLKDVQVCGKDFETLDVHQTKNLEDPDTQNSALNDIIAALEDENKQIIGIYGFGGVGKTTLAMEIAARVKNNNMLLADDVAFTTVSQTINAKKIQKDLENATKRIKKGDKILIILDDIWEKLDLEELCIPCGNNYMNCKILLTSRSEKVCQKMNAQSKICVNSLPTEEAWVVFKGVVGERLETDSNLKPVALKVIEECGGLPLLIQAVGNALKDESIESWNWALKQLQEHAPLDIDVDIQKSFTRLQLSYDYLESKEAKRCFLLCSLFHEAEEIELEDLVRYMVGLELFDHDLDSIEDARDRVRNAVNMLTSSCLLLTAEDDKRCTKMHKVVRDVALLIGSQREHKYLLKAGNDLIESLPRDNNVKDLTDYKKIKFDDFHGSYYSMIKKLDKKGPLRVVTKATNHYHDRNIIKDGEFGKVLKFLRNGRLMYVAVRRLDRQYGENNVDFRREHEILSALKHDNISSILEYSDEDGENIIAYEHAFHGILHGHLSNPALAWSRRLQICLGVARALNYIHNQGLIHCDINSSKILLDEDWKPKIFGFERCTEYPQSWTHRLHLSRYLGTRSVMTPNYDVHLFGDLLIQVLCEKKPMFVKDDFNGKVDDNIIPSLRKHIGSRSMKFFKNIAYNCLVKKLAEGPSMNQIVKQLEEALELQRIEENLELSTNGDEGASQDRLLMDNLEISLIEIKNATGHFTKGRIGYGGFGTVYKAKLNVLDIQSVSSIIGKSKDELPMKISKTVAIKQLSKNGDEQAEERFLTEIKSLTSCIHPNVVSLLGFSKEANEMILVFEYASKGDLSDYLRSEHSQTWSQRLQICLQVARGINCLHTNNIIHRDIKSKNILLDENLNAKVADFGLSKLIPTVGEKSTILTKNLVGTGVYIDPEYRTTGGYKKESDIYAFGVVLFEMLSGKMAYDSTYTREYDDGLAPIVRRRFQEGTLTELIDPKMFEEDDEHTFTLNRGPTKDSFDLFSKVGYKCLAKNRAERPKMEVVIKALEDALEVQGKTMKLSRFRLSSIELATQNFAKTYYMGLDTSGNKVYKAQLEHFESNNLLAAEGKNNGEPPKISIAIKRFSGGEDERGEEGFFSELEMHTRYKHPNIVPLLGFCYEGDNMLLVYEHDSDESLDNYLRDAGNMTKHTWIQRLHQCLGIAHGLNHLHTQMDRKQEVIHVDIRSANILVGKSGEAKIAYFGFSKLLPANQEASTNTTNKNVHTKVYCCPEYQRTGELKKQSDIYSFGVVLFEIFCGRVAYDLDYTVKNENGLAPIARRCFREGTIKEIIDPTLKEETSEDILASYRERIYDSFGTYLRIANQCLAENQAERPTMQIVIKELEKAFTIQMKFLEISIIEIMDATKNFDNACVVASGSFGIVYRATLDVLDIQSVSSIVGKSKDELPRKSKAVAIKRLSNKGDEKGFLAEIELLTSCKHPNIVSLLGFYRDANETILVYEFALNGSLSDYLLGSKLSLSWSQRIQICLQVAQGINYLHTNMEDKPSIVHRDIQSKNILLDENLNAKVADFGLSTLHPTADGGNNTIVTRNLAGTDLYMDPEYWRTGGYKKESDIYSFGVVLFEVLSGKMAYDITYMRENDYGLAPIVRRRFKDGTLMELIDPKMFEEDGEHTFTLNKGPTQDSLDLFSKVGYECLAKTQAERPQMEVVIKTLQDALEVQGKTMKLSRFRLSSIQVATENFAKTYYMGLDTSGNMVYKAQLDHFESNNLLATEGKNNGELPKRHISIAIKRFLGGEDERGEEGFFSELEMGTRYKHPNIVSLLGFCYEGDNMLLVYEHDSDESLDNYLRDSDNMTKLTWIQRLHLCLGIANGLDYLHTLMDRKQDMVHVDIRSANILLGKSGEAKIAYFGFSKLFPPNQEASTDDTTNDNLRTKVYCCPEYQKTKESDIYSFGVVLFEIFCGSLAYDPVYTDKNDNGLAPIARQCFSDGTIKEMIDPALTEETSEDILTSNREPISDSLGTCLRIANQCLAENQEERPTMQIVIKELEITLNTQETLKTSQISFKDVKSATGNFSQKNCFGSGKYWKAYKGKLRHSNANLASASASGGGGASAGPTASDANANTNTYFIVAKRWNSKSNQGDHQFRTELSVIIKLKHENIIGLVGYCHEMDERMIVYKQASKGSLDMYLNDATLTWMKRLQICTDVARALEFLHGGNGMLKKVVHRNIQSSAILLYDDWKAKISNLEMSSLDSLQQDMEHVSDNAYGAFGYLDPEYKQGYLTEKSDIYSFGVVMFEILCGRLASPEGFEDHSESLGPLAKRHYEEGKLDEMVFKGIKEQIGPESMAIYADIAYQCLHDIGDKRPTAGKVVIQLEKLLDLQVQAVQNLRSKVEQRDGKGVKKE